jgi:hypothetical protein
LGIPGERKVCSGIPRKKFFLDVSWLLIGWAQIRCNLAADWLSSTYHSKSKIGLQSVIKLLKGGTTAQLYLYMLLYIFLLFAAWNALLFFYQTKFVLMFRLTNVRTSDTSRMQPPLACSGRNRITLETAWSTFGQIYHFHLNNHFQCS